MSVQQHRWAELIEGQVARGKTRDEAERLLAARYPRLAACVGKAATVAAAPARGVATGDPIAEWNEEVRALCARGLTRQRAVSKLAAERPDLREAYVAAYNETHQDARSAGGKAR